MKFLNKIDGADKLITDANNRLVTDAQINEWDNKGDMLKAVYDNNDGIVDNADKLDGKHASDLL